MISNDFVFQVQGVPVRCVRDSNHSISLRAVQRGFFPCSPTGYRAITGSWDHVALTDEQIQAKAEAVAAEKESERAGQLREAEQSLRDLSDALRSREPFGGLGSPVSDGISIIGRALFQRDADRERMLRIALTILSTVVETFPARVLDYTDAGAWTSDQVASSILAAVVGCDVIRALLADQNDRACALMETMPNGRYVHAGAFAKVPDAPRTAVVVPVGETLDMFA